MTTKMTITEALAECKLTVQKISSAEGFVEAYLTRPDQYRDPLLEHGGSAQVIKEKLQAIGDWRERIIKIRKSINDANRTVVVEIGGVSRTIEEWLIWKREVYNLALSALRTRQDKILRVRSGGGRRDNVRLVPSGEPTKEGDIVVNVSEVGLQQEIERLTTMHGELDGKLSLLDATTMVEIPD